MINNKYIFPYISDYDKQLPVYVVTVGSETVANNDENRVQTVRPAGIPDHQFLFTTKGRASVFFNGREYVAGPESLIYHSPNTPHRYEGISGEWTHYWITFAMHNNFSLFELKNGVYDLNDTSSFIDIIKDIISLKNTIEFGENASLLLYKLILKMKRKIEYNISDGAYCVLSASIEYINENFTDEMDLETLADITGVTQGYYCKLFKDYYHLRPFEYICQLRIQKAKSLLFSNMKMSVAEIGERVGFQSTSYFIKQFKKQENITPLEFRKRYNIMI